MTDERRDDVSRLFELTRAQPSQHAQAGTIEVSARVFGVDAGAERPLAEGDLVGPYRIVSLLGAGGQAYVYEARHRDLDRTVALKVPYAELATRIAHEARTTARLAHDHVVRVEDIRSDWERPYLVMELCPGGSLADEIAKHPRGMSLERIAEVSRALLSALGFAHEQGVVHRDVKPENILFDERGQVKLSDLGIGLCSTQGPRLAASLALSAVTREAIAGTPLYMAPEQEHPERLADGERLDGRADLFAFGKVLFEMLTGATARTIRPPSRLREGLDPAWDDLVFRLLEEDRARRPRDAARVLDDVLRLAGAPAGAAVAPRARARARDVDDAGPAPRAPLADQVVAWVGTATGLFVFGNHVVSELGSGRVEPGDPSLIFGVMFAASALLSLPLTYRAWRPEPGFLRTWVGAFLLGAAAFGGFASAALHAARTEFVALGSAPGEALFLLGLGAVGALALGTDRLLRRLPGAALVGLAGLVLAKLAQRPQLAAELRPAWGAIEPSAFVMGTMAVGGAGLALWLVERGTALKRLLLSGLLGLGYGAMLYTLAGADAWGIVVGVVLVLLLLRVAGGSAEPQAAAPSAPLPGSAPTSRPSRAGAGDAEDGIVVAPERTIPVTPRDATTRPRDAAFERWNEEERARSVERRRDEEAQKRARARRKLAEARLRQARRKDEGMGGFILRVIGVLGGLAAIGGTIYAAFVAIVVVGFLGALGRACGGSNAAEVAGVTSGITIGAGLIIAVLTWGIVKLLRR